MTFNIKMVWGKYCKLWHDLSGWKLFLFYTLHYTLLFVVLQNFVFSAFYTAEKSFVWGNDGLSQYFVRLTYISQIIRNGIQSLFSGNGWTIPLYDFRVGLVRQDLQIFLPQILSVLWPWDNIDSLYDLHVLTNYYFVGLAFAVFGFYFKQRPLSIMTGAITYSFCGFALYSGVRHPYFLTPMIILPILIIACEKILKKEKGFLLLFIVALSLVTQYGLYYSCMQAVFVIIYVLIRFFSIYKINRLHEFLDCWGRLLIYGGTGILLSCCVIIPTLYSILSTGRVGNNIFDYINIFYFNIEYYEKFLTNFTVLPGGLDNYTCLNFSVLAIPSLIFLFIRNKEYERDLRYIFIVLTIMLCIPMIGYMMSGFSNVSNRFGFSYGFCISVIIMFMVPRFQELNLRSASLMCIVLIGYFIICYFFIDDKLYSAVPFILLLLFMLLVTSGFYLNKKLIAGFCLCITCLSVFYTANGRYSEEGLNYVSQFVSNASETLAQGQYCSLGKNDVIKNDNSVFHVTGNGITDAERNFSFYYNLNGLSMHPYYGWSSDYLNWLSEMETPRYSGSQVAFGLDSHSILLALANVKYYADRNTDRSVIPYGFREIDSVKNGQNKDVIMVNENWLPIGYTYENYLIRENYDKLTTLGKQEAQIQAVVLDDIPSLVDDISEKDIITTGKKIPYEIIETNNLTWNDGILKVKDKNASITLKFSGMPETETYLRIVNLDLTNGADTRHWTLTASTDNTSAKGHFMADGYLYANKQHTQMLPMGYTEDGYANITIVFPSKGTFILDDIEIWCQPMDNFVRQISNLKKEVLQNVEINWRGLTGNISVSKNKMLCFAIPYMDGWKAYVDGMETKVYKANTAFMAIELSEGEHNVELCYNLPGFSLGIVLSIIGLFCLLIILLWSKIKFYISNQKLL